MSYEDDGAEVLVYPDVDDGAEVLVYRDVEMGTGVPIYPDGLWDTAAVPQLTTM